MIGKIVELLRRELAGNRQARPGTGAGDQTVGSWRALAYCDPRDGAPTTVAVRQNVPPLRPSNGSD